MRVFTREFFEERADWGAPDRDPIFVLGMPRAGSTLIEQILSSHPEIEGTKELPEIPIIAKDLGRGRGIDFRNVAELGRLRSRELGDGISRMGGAPAQERPALLRRQDAEQLASRAADPAAASEREDHRCAPASARLRILQLQAELRRDGIDVQLRPSGDRTLLPRICADDGAHATRCSPAGSTGSSTSAWSTTPKPKSGACSTISELPFDPACLRFYETERAVRTPSAEQVRRPISRAGVEQWTKFEQWLGPLKEALGPVLDAYPGVPAEFEH